MKKAKVTDSKFVWSTEFNSGKDFYKKYNRKYLLSKSIIEFISGLTVTNSLDETPIAKYLMGDKLIAKLRKLGDEKDWMIWDILFMSLDFYNLKEQVGHYQVNGCNVFACKINGENITFVLKGNQISLPKDNPEFPNDFKVVIMENLTP
jgi:hypothetical protein